MASKQGTVPGNTAVSPPSLAFLKQQQQQQQMMSSNASPRLNLFTPPDGNTPASNNHNNSTQPANTPTSLPPGVSNFGGMALPLFLAQQQIATQQQIAASGQQQTAQPVYICPPGIQFPYYFPNSPLPYPHPGTTGPFPPNATAAMLAAMMPQAQNNQSLPASPFFSAPGMATPITPVFRFNPSQQPQQQQQGPQTPLVLPQSQTTAQQQQQQLTPNPLSAALQHQAEHESNRRLTASSKPSADITPFRSSQTSTVNVNGNDTAGPVNNSSLPHFPSATAGAVVATTAVPSSLSSPKQAIINSPTGVIQQQQQQSHVIRQNTLLSHDSSNSQQQPQQQLQDQELQQKELDAAGLSTLRQRKRPPNIKIPQSNFDATPAGTDAPGASAPKTPKTAPNGGWTQPQTPRGIPGTQPIWSAGHLKVGRKPGRPPLGHKPPIHSADHILAGGGNVFPSGTPSHFSSTSSTYNSPSLLAATSSANAHSTASFSNAGSDVSAQQQQQQDVVVNSPSHLLYPEHFKRGSLIRLADSSFKRVEDMITSDFTRSAQLSGELQLDSSQVLQIEPNQSRGAAMLYLAVGDQSPINIHVEAPLEHPFFVFNVGWSSCDPERTRVRYGLSVQPLRIGDKCISLTRKPPKSANATSSISSATTTGNLQPALPPPPPPATLVQTTTPAVVTTKRCASDDLQLEPPIKSKPEEGSESKLEHGQPGPITQGEADKESIATASLLSLQQSDELSQTTKQAPAISSATAVIRYLAAENAASFPPCLEIDEGSNNDNKQAETSQINENSIESESAVDTAVNGGKESLSQEDTLCEKEYASEDESSTASMKLEVAETAEDNDNVVEPVKLETAACQLSSMAETLHQTSKEIPNQSTPSLPGLRRRRSRSTSAVTFPQLLPNRIGDLTEFEGAHINKDDASNNVNGVNEASHSCSQSPAANSDTAGQEYSHHGQEDEKEEEEKEGERHVLLSKSSTETEELIQVDTTETVTVSPRCSLGLK